MQKVWLTWVGPDPRVTCRGCDWEFEAEWKELLDAIGISGSGA